jgi:repressor LexA
MKMSEFGRRLQYLRSKKDMTQEDLAKVFKISKSAISMYERGEREPAFDLVQRMADYFGVSVDYLLARKPNRIYDTLGKGLDAFFPPKLLDSKLVHIPIVAEIPCGTPVATEDNIIGYFPVDVNFVNVKGGDYVWIRAVGDSMNNANIPDGSLVLIRLQPEVQPGEIAAVCIDNESATLKRVYFDNGNVILSPDSTNPIHKPMVYEAYRIKIVGLVKGVFIQTR